MTRRNRSRGRNASRKQRKHDATIKAVAEFYTEVAKTLDLPPRAMPAPPPPPPRLTREEAIKAIRARPALQIVREWWLPGLAALILAVTGGYYWWPAGKAAVPEDFRGTWVTGNAAYAGRMIVVSMETIEIVAGRRAATGPVAVTAAKVDTTTDGIRLRLVYGATGKEQTLEMMLHPGRPATITLLRPANVVWERLEGSTASPGGEAVVPNP